MALEWKLLWLFEVTWLTFLGVKKIAISFLLALARYNVHRIDLWGLFIMQYLSSPPGGLKSASMASLMPILGTPSAFPLYLIVNIFWLELLKHWCYVVLNWYIKWVKTSWTNHIEWFTAWNKIKFIYNRAIDFLDMQYNLWMEGCIAD